MANKNLTASAKVSEESPPRKGSLFKKLLILFLILMLGGVGFALGIYLKFIDPQKILSNMKLHEYPVIGQYFAPPKTNFEPVELDNDSNLADIPKPVIEQPVQQLTPVTPNEAEREKILKARQQEEIKKISKLARLYENMKPEEVVPIISKLDDTVIIAIFNKMDEAQVAKVMALLDADRAARLSQAMLKVKTPEVR